MAAKHNPKANPIAIVRRRTELLAVADRILAAPPAKPWVRRPTPLGSRVARFILPLVLCQATNRTRGAPPWKLGKDKGAVWLAMRAQCAPWDRPLRGRPQVLCVRFTRVLPDPFADWAKHAVDVLCAPTTRAPRKRLNIIVDDRPAAADVVQWAEPTNGRPSFVVIDVWTGGNDG